MGDHQTENAMTDDQLADEEEAVNAIRMREEARNLRNQSILHEINDRHKKAMERLQSPTTKTCPTCGKEL